MFLPILNKAIALTKAYIAATNNGRQFAFRFCRNDPKIRSLIYMKKQILLIAFTAISAFAIAQVKPTFGVRAGIVSAGMRGDAVNSLTNILDFTNGMITTGNRTGFFAGSYATVSLTDIISLEPAVYYSQKGYALTGALNVKGAGFLGANARAQLNAHYIDLPVLVKANLSGFQVFAGPQVSYLVSSDLRTTAGVLGINLLNTKINATSQFNRLDAAVTGGIGYQFGKINVMASYDYGILKTDANRNMKLYNQSFRLGIGMTL